ncbi:MAG: hypothetical protein ABI852_13485 [Gemmatimonadaceae bacterium]
MRRSLWILLVIVLVGVPALILTATRTDAARVLGKDERIHVMASTGQWYHEYLIRAGIPGSGANEGMLVDSFTATTSRNQFDATRVGARVRLSHAAFLRRFSWIADSASRMQTIANIAEPHLKYYYNPSAVSPLAAQTAGLARVVAVHSVQRRKFFWQKSEPDAGSPSQWIHLVEVEFWAMRVRTLVHTIDVIDAGSIPGLQPGDIVQMHYDQRDPRVLRLDDGRRTFARKP